MRSRAYTLIEILIASAMAVMVLGALIRVFWFGRGVERSARSSYLIRQDADIAFRQIQDDLRLSHLASIRVEDGDKGFSLPSPIEKRKTDSFELTPFGVCEWKSFVHYALTGDEKVGTLVRWESPYPEKEHLPRVSPDKPSAVSGGFKETLLPNVVSPGFGPKDGADGLKVLDKVSDGGGLQLRFVRYEGDEEVLSPVNPSQKSDKDADGWSQGSTTLVQCQLQVADVSSESGKLSLYTLKFRVKPRN